MARVPRQLVSCRPILGRHPTFQPVAWRFWLARSFCVLTQTSARRQSDRTQLSMASFMRKTRSPFFAACSILLVLSLALQSALSHCMMSLPASTLSASALVTPMVVEAGHAMHGHVASALEGQPEKAPEAPSHRPHSGRDLAFHPSHPEAKRPCPVSVASLHGTACCAPIAAVSTTDPSLVAVVAMIMKPGEQLAYSSHILTLDPPPPRA